MANNLHETIKKMAHLSKIAITEEEEALFATSLTAILDYFGGLSQFDTTHTPALYSVLDEQTLGVREDQIGQSLSKEAFLKNAPASIGGLIKVPQVLKSS